MTHDAWRKAVRRGAHWIHMPDINPVAQLAAKAGVDVYAAPPGQKVRIGRRYARKAEMEDYLVGSGAGQARDRRKAARKGERFMPGRPCRKISANGNARSSSISGLGAAARNFRRCHRWTSPDPAERDIDAFCRIGFGGLLGRLADGIDVQLSTPVTRIGWGGKSNVEVETARGSSLRGARHRHGIEWCVERWPHQVHAGSAASPA